MSSSNLLEQSLKNTQASNNDQKFIEDHFDKIVTLLEQEKINEAWAVIEKCFAKAIPDIRLIVYYFYALFFRQGIKCFLEIFPTITSLINEHWEILKPLNRKEKQIESSLNWFFSLSVNKLKYCEKLHRAGKNHPIWEKSVNETSKEEFESLPVASNNFKDFFFEKWPKSPLKDRLMHLSKKIEEIADFGLMGSQKMDQEEAVPSSDEETSVEEINTAEEINTVEEDEPHNEESEEMDHAACIEEEFAREEDRMYSPEERSEDLVQEELEASPAPSDPMEILRNKLEIFEILINKNEYMKAALVAKDINHRIETFDPIEYFPKLFANFFSILARHIYPLSEQWESRESLQIKYLEKLYQTDLDKFMEW